MTTYTGCTGTGETLIDTRVIRTTQPKFFHLNGKRVGTCQDCGRSGLGAVPRDGTWVAPKHKAH
jgi:hypothetical protein